MTTPSELYQKDGVFLEINIDEDIKHPRQKDMCFGTIIALGGAYSLSDDGDRSRGSLDIKTHMEDLPIDTVKLPLYLLDHSGLRVSTEPFNCTWDSGQIGFIYATPEQVKEIGLRKNEDVVKALINEVEIFSMYLEGRGYGFTKYEKDTCPTCNHSEKIIIDSCWGFYGSDHKKSGLLANTNIDSLDSWEKIK